jgi:4-amino-4-deoxy-L-arabinose transferase-like glycosyltransferase
MAVPSPRADRPPDGPPEVAGTEDVGARASRPALWPPLWVGLALALFLLGAYCRFANLADNPGWDGDEGYNWSIAAHLAHGQVQMFALRYAFVQHPPLFYLLGAALMRVWSEDLLPLRLLSATCGMLTACAVFGLANQLGGRRLGVAAAAIYLVWPLSVMQVRWAYTYNLLSLLVVLGLWMALAAVATQDAWSITRRAALAGVITGLALATDQEAAPLVLALALLLQPRGVRPLVVGLAAACLPPLLYLSWMLAIRPADLRFDLGHTASRLGGGPIVVIARLIHLVQFDPLVGLGLLGLVAVGQGRPRAALLALTALLTLIVLEVRDPNPFFRAAEPLLPLAALGLGALMLWVLALIGRYVAARRRPAIAMLFALGLGLPMLAADLQGAGAGFATALAPTLPGSTGEARRMADWVNARCRPTDLVIVMPTTAWLFHCRTADLLQAAAIEGRAAGFYPAGLDPKRFQYDTHLDAARYLVVDAFTMLWIADPGAREERRLVGLARRRWPVVYRRGEYTIYRNPVPSSRA